MLEPTALVTWNCTQVTVREENVTARPPLSGTAPTGTVLPSLKSNLPAMILSTGFGRS